jgi:hypothetical protein
MHPPPPPGLLTASARSAQRLAPGLFCDSAWKKDPV